jgi:hypothetical protein
MLAKAAIALVVTSIVLGGVTVCPKGALSCPTRKQANHRCCAHADAIHAADCCAAGAHSPSAAIKTGDANSEHDSSAKLLASFQVPASVFQGGWQVFGRQYRLLRAGPAPPRTPITEHTSLLL